jgi:hypothetical protein
MSNRTEIVLPADQSLSDTSLGSIFFSVRVLREAANRMSFEDDLHNPPSFATRTEITERS